MAGALSPASLESHDGLCRLFAAEGGFKVIAVDYRLAPSTPGPAAVDDAFAAYAVDRTECQRCWASTPAAWR